MDSFDFDKLPFTPFPKGTYMVVHDGVIPASGFVLSNVKIIPGWPNPALEACRTDGASHVWLEIVDKLAFSNERPEFNMGVFQVDGSNRAAAIYGPFEKAHPVQLLRLQENHLSLLPEECKHLAHLY